MRSWKGNQPWITTRMIKGPEDYKVVKYMVEHTEYIADYFPIEQALEWLGEEGVVLDGLPHSPMQMLMIHWVGSEGGRFFYDLADYPDLVEDAGAGCLQESGAAVRDRREIAGSDCAVRGQHRWGAGEPGTLDEVFHAGVREAGAPLHRHGKLMAVHMDGRVADLKHLIAQTPIDIVEALHPIPMGDLSIAEALALWKDKAIWLGFPGAIYELGTQATQEFAVQLLREIGSGERLALAMSTENQVTNENLLTLTAVLENAALPLAPEVITRIEHSIA